MADAGPIPLTPAQELIAVGQTLAGDAPIYNMGWRIEIRGPLDPAMFAAALRSVAEQRDALRLRFDQRGRRTLQSFDSPIEDHVFHDLGGRADPLADAEAQIAADAAQAFTLSEAAWRSRLFRLTDRRWVWFFCQHHVATDAMSGQALFDAAAAAYGRRDLRRATPYRSFASRRRDATAAAAHWEAAAEAPADADAPYGKSRDLTRPWSTAREIGFGTANSARLDALVATPAFRALSPDLGRFAVFAAVHAAWLRRVAGTRDVRFGAPAHLRFTAEDRAALGLFVEVFPFRLGVADDATLRSLASAARAEATTWLRHAAPGASNAAAARCFNSVLNYLPISFGGFAGLEADVALVHSGAHDPNHDLQLSITRFAGQGAPFNLHFRLNRGVFGEGDVARAPEQWLAMAGAMLSDPDRRVVSVPLGGRRLHGGARPPRPPVLDAFAERVRMSPDAPAIEDAGRRLSYRQFDAMASSYAEGVRRAGVRRGAPVIVYGKRSIEAVAAIWGVMRAGASFVPLSSGTPTARAKSIATAHGLGWAIRSPETEMLDLGGLIDPAAPCGSFDPPPGRDEAAYTIFTSGSTGAPKGVSVDHEGLADYIGWAAQEHPGDYALHSALGFDLTVTALFAPLVSGRRIVVYPETGDPDLAAVDVFRDDRVDVVKLTPAHLTLALEAVTSVSRIRTLILGGAALPTQLARRAAALSPAGVEIANEYGPTESVVGAMLHRFDPATDVEATVSIGRPAEGVEIAVIDASGAPAPPGVIGEIHIGGRLARGYLDDPALTEARFAAVDGRRMYRTGDFARVSEDGRVSYLGRSDDQVKVSGVRIEPAEIAAALEALPGVRRAHVGLWRPGVYDPEAPACARCGLSEQAPGGERDAQGLCATCRDFDAFKERADAYFATPDRLAAIVEGLRGRRRGRFDAAMLLSGGKDSTYALYRLAELTPDILCLTLDNGYLSDAAKANIRAVARDLRLEHRFLATPAMPAIFRDSLLRHANVCQGCFKTIYTLALRVAREEGVPAIATGLSRGQFFETRLTPELFASGAPDAAQIEATILAARKSYHQVDDAVKRHLDTRDLADPAIFDDIAFLDLYRYIDVEVEEVYRFLAARSWRRPADTGRSTNCRINDLGIFVHTRREGYHNYAVPYAWDVRMRHKRRDAALAELRDEIDAGRMRAILREIDLEPEEALAARPAELAAWVVGDGDPSAWRAALGETLPSSMTPRRIARVSEIPLTVNGKVDEAALPLPPSPRAEAQAYVRPEPGLETALANLIAGELGIDRVGATDNFYDLGGDSLMAIRIALRGAEAGLALAATDLFQHRTVRNMAAILAERAPPESGNPAPRRPLVAIGADDLAAIGRALGER